MTGDQNVEWIGDGLASDHGADDVHLRSQITVAATQVFRVVQRHQEAAGVLRAGEG